MVLGDSVTDGGVVSGTAVIWTRPVPADESMVLVYSVQVPGTAVRRAGELLTNTADVEQGGEHVSSNVVVHHFGSTSAVFLPMVVQDVE